MQERELLDKVRQQYVKEVVGEKKQRTLEDALQEALDNTTPEFPGAPNSRTEKPEDQTDAEWI